MLDNIIQQRIDLENKNKLEKFKKDKNMIYVGDFVKTREGILPFKCGRVRYVGMLEGCGTDNSVWSDWMSMKWDEVILPKAKGGTLTAREEHDLEAVETTITPKNLVIPFQKEEKKKLIKEKKYKKHPMVITDDDL